MKLPTYGDIIAEGVRFFNLISKDLCLVGVDDVWLYASARACISVDDELTALADEYAGEPGRGRLKGQSDWDLRGELIRYEAWKAYHPGAETRLERPEPTPEPAPQAAYVVDIAWVEEQVRQLQAVIEAEIMRVVKVTPNTNTLHFEGLLTGDIQKGEIAGTLSVDPPAAKKCECGVTATGVGGLHSDWCPEYEP